MFKNKKIKSFWKDTEAKTVTATFHLIDTDTV